MISQKAASANVTSSSSRTSSTTIGTSPVFSTLISYDKSKVPSPLSSGPSDILLINSISGLIFIVTGVGILLSPGPSPSASGSLPSVDVSDKAVPSIASPVTVA